MLSDGALLVVALVGLSATISLVLFFAGFFSRPAKIEDARAAGNEGEAAVGGARRPVGGLAALRKRKDKKRRGADGERGAEQEQGQEEEPPAAAAAAPADAAAEDGEVEPRAMTKKELQKELKRREREEMRRFEEEQREEQRRRAAAKDEILQKKREEEAKLEEEREELERKLAEEKAKKEQEEFDKWKDMFTVEEEGSKLAEDSEESQMLLQQFVDYIKTHKVVLLEDLAAEFNLATRDAIQRVEALQESNRLTGIVDDRGKFIYITDEEMDKVAKFIQRRGRLSIAELAKECNKLIRLDVQDAGAKPSADALDWLNSDEPQPQADLTV